MRDIGADEFEAEVLKEDRVVLVDFYADWCGPCRMMKPILGVFAKEHSDIKVVGINVDKNEELAEQYEVSTIPCMMVFRNGIEVAREIGVQPEKELLKMTEAKNED